MTIRGLWMSLVFVSYSRRNSQFVRQLVEKLRFADVPIWIDQEDIIPGQKWDASIEEALSQSTHFLVLLSEQSVISDHVMNEIIYAIERKKIIIPVKIDKCETPLVVSRFQFVDFHKENFELNFHRLLSILPSDPNQEINVNKPESTVKFTPDIMSQLLLSLISFPEERQAISEGGDYLYPVLQFKIQDHKRDWIMKFHTIYVGRTFDCDIVLDSEPISRRHLMIFRDEQKRDKYYVQDLGSMNGTWLNGGRIGNDKVVLSNGDVIDMARQVEIVFKLETIQQSKFGTQPLPRV